LSNPIKVLLVEDHPADIALTKRALSQLGTPTELHITLDGRDAMNFLSKHGRYASAPRPDIILLDLNMPRMGGIEVLQEIHTLPDLRSIPIIVLTTSAAPADVLSAYTYCANGYLVKPVKFAEFLALLQTFESYWLRTSLIPKS
jgi:CheY-like chemotaxis protein